MSTPSNPYDMPMGIQREIVLHHSIVGVPNPLRVRVDAGDMFSHSYLKENHELMAHLYEVVYKALCEFREAHSAITT